MTATPSSASTPSSTSTRLSRSDMSMASTVPLALCERPSTGGPSECAVAGQWVQLHSPHVRPICQWPRRHATTLKRGPIRAAESPFSEGSVLMTPDGVPPAMALSGPVRDVVLVDLDTQARAAGDGDEAVRVREYRRIGEVVQQVVVDVVMNTEALFLDEGVVGAGVDLQAGGKGDGAERAVQRDRDVVRLCHRGDLAGLADPAGVRWVRLDDIDGSTAQERLEIPS